MEEQIRFKSIHRFKGVLFNWHKDTFCGEHYEMVVYDNEGNEILHSYNAKPTTLEELKAVVLNCQHEIEIARSEEKNRQAAWRQLEREKEIEKRKEDKKIFYEMKKLYGKYVIQYKTGEKYKTVFKNNEPICFETKAEASAYMKKLMQLHPEMKFRAKKRLLKEYM